MLYFPLLILFIGVVIATYQDKLKSEWDDLTNNVHHRANIASITAICYILSLYILIMNVLAVVYGERDGYFGSRGFEVSALYVLPIVTLSLQLVTLVIVLPLVFLFTVLCMSNRKWVSKFLCFVSLFGVGSALLSLSLNIQYVLIAFATDPLYAGRIMIYYGICIFVYFVGLRHAYLIPSKFKLCKFLRSFCNSCKESKCTGSDVESGKEDVRVEEVVREGMQEVQEVVREKTDEVVREGMQEVQEVVREKPDEVVGEGMQEVQEVVREKTDEVVGGGMQEVQEVVREGMQEVQEVVREGMDEVVREGMQEVQEVVREKTQAVVGVEKTQEMLERVEEDTRKMLKRLEDETQSTGMGGGEDVKNGGEAKNESANFVYMLFGLCSLIVVHLTVGLFFGYIPINRAIEETTSAVSVVYSGAVILFGAIVALSVLKEESVLPK